MASRKKQRKLAAEAGEPRGGGPRRTRSGGLAAWLDARPSLEPPGLRQSWPFLAGVFVAIFAVYVWSAPRTIVLEDDGEFVTVVHHFGVAHAPGFPLFVLLAKPFTWLPIGSVAFRVHLASAFFGAAACSALWWVIRTITARPDLALVAALAFGLSEAFWSQAIIADVYSLNTLLLFIWLAVALAYVHRPNRRLVGAMALVVGLGLSNHWPLFALAAPCVLMVLVPVRAALIRDLLSRLLPVTGLLLAGLLPYAVMVIRSQSAPLLAFTGSLDRISDIWVYISRVGYAGIENSPTAGVGDKLMFAGFLARETLWQFTPLGALLAAVGVATQWTRLRAAAGLGLIAGFASATFLLIGLIRWDYEFLWRSVFRVYPLLPYGVVAIWLALGLAWIEARLRERFGPSTTIVVRAVGAILVVVLAVTNAGRNNRSGYTFARDYAATLLNSFEPNAVVITHGDVDINTLFYHHFVEGMRPDIRLLNDQGLGMATDEGGRLFDPVRTTPADKASRTVAFARESNRPVYFIGQAPVVLSDIEYGLFRKINPARAAAPGQSITSFALEPRFVEFLRGVLNSPPSPDPWTVEHRGVVVRQMAYVMTALLDLGAQGTGADRTDLDRVTAELPGLLGRLQLLDAQNAASGEQLLALAEKGETLVNDTISRRDRAALMFVKARALSKVGRRDEAIRTLEQSMAFDPSAENPSSRELNRLRRAPAGN